MAAEIHYFALIENPHVKGLSEFRQVRRQRVRIENPEYRVAVLPGPGILAVRIPWDQDLALPRVGRRTEPIPAIPYGFRKGEFLGHVRLDPAADSSGVTCEIGVRTADDEHENSTEHRPTKSVRPATYR